MIRSRRAPPLAANRGIGGHERKLQAEARIGAFAVEPQGSAMVLDDALRDAEAQTRAQPDFLGSEERLHDLLRYLRGNARAGIGYGNPGGTELGLNTNFNP